MARGFSRLRRRRPSRRKGRGARDRPRCRSGWLARRHRRDEARDVLRQRRKALGVIFEYMLQEKQRIGLLREAHALFGKRSADRADEFGGIDAGKPLLIGDLELCVNATLRS